MAHAPERALNADNEDTARRFFPKLQNPRSARSFELPHRLNTYRHTPLELLFQAAENSRRYSGVGRRLRQSYFAVQGVGEYRRQKLPHLLFVGNPLLGQLCRTRAPRNNNSLKDYVGSPALPRPRQCDSPSDRSDQGNTHPDMSRHIGSVKFGSATGARTRTLSLERAAC